MGNQFANVGAVDVVLAGPEMPGFRAFWQTYPFAARVREQAKAPKAQVELAYRIALARPPTDEEIRISTALVETQSLDAFAHVVLNLDEFMYMR